MQELKEPRGSKVNHKVHSGNMGGPKRVWDIGKEGCTVVNMEKC